MQKHFFHPDYGHWVAIKSPSAEVLATYPEGTIEVPPKPSPYAEWVNGTWVDHPAPPPSREEQEALRQAAYIVEADPIAMQMLRDEATKEEWLAKIEEIKLRYPYYD
jgi:hypothetical protein